MNCFTTIVKEEGIKGLFRGLFAYIVVVEFIKKMNLYK